MKKATINLLLLLFLCYIFSVNPESYEEYHEEFNPPPDGYYTGLQNKSKVRSVIDDSNDKEQIQIRYNFHAFRGGFIFCETCKLPYFCIYVNLAELKFIDVKIELPSILI